MLFGVKFILIFWILAPPASVRTQDVIFPEDDDDEPDMNEILTSNEQQFNDDDDNKNQQLEYGNHFEGDIELLPEQEDLLDSDDDDDDTFSTRTGILWESYRWPKNRNGKVIIPYKVDQKSKFSRAHLEIIQKAMSDIEKYTCVRFNKRTNEQDYIRIESGNDCHSKLGKIGGRQELSLKKSGCMERGIIIHELIHTLGYKHMQSHADRDKYVEIKVSNIQRDHVSQFIKVDKKSHGNFGTDYDYYSVMHYDRKAWSKNGKDTIVPRNKKFLKVIGQRKGMSKGDKQRINNMYKCQ